ncbi:MAG TPA: hypothetical protein VFF07_03415 [Actinomycetota bacterium]|nr:hypothetical protein [Actinomycetota bacterium]
MLGARRDEGAPPQGPQAGRRLRLIERRAPGYSIGSRARAYVFHRRIGSSSGADISLAAMSLLARTYLALFYQVLVVAVFVLNPVVALAQEVPEGEVVETGPPWTYQMAKITLVMLLLLGLSIGAIYYRLVVRRRRGDA